MHTIKWMAILTNGHELHCLVSVYNKKNSYYLFIYTYLGLKL